MFFIVIVLSQPIIFFILRVLAISLLPRFLYVKFACLVVGLQPVCGGCRVALETLE
jgi:hypothetical protein